MNQRSDNNYISNKTSGDKLVKEVSVATDGSQGLVDVDQTSTRSTEDDIELQCTSKDIDNLEREPMFIIVDSSFVKNSNCETTLIDKRHNPKKYILKEYLNKNDSSIDMPSTSRYYGIDNTATQLKESETMDEWETTNLQNEKVNPLNEDNEKLSETSLDVHSLSYHGSPRSLHIGSGYSMISLDDRHSKLKHAVDFLHSDNDFLVAAETGDDKLLKIILSKGPNLQQTDHLGRNALHLAVCSGNERAVILLLKAGVNPNIKDNVGMTPLSLCLMRSPSTKLVNLLFDYGAIILPRSSPTDIGLFLQFIMMSVPTNEEENIIRLLVTKGALVNDPEAPGQRQALHFAAMSNNCHLIKILVKLGANLYDVNHRNETPREVAMTFRCKEACAMLEEMEEHDCNI